MSGLVNWSTLSGGFALRLTPLALGPSLLVLLGVTFFSLQATAQSKSTGEVVTVEATGAPLSHLELGPPSENPINLRLPVGRAQLLRLPVDVKDVIVSHAAVADVVVKSPNLIYMLGQSEGSTSVVMLDGAAQIIYSLNIIVAQELSNLKSILRTVLPEEKINVTSMQGNIILTGKVRKSTSPTIARDLARRFVADDTQIINHLQVLADQQVMLRVRISEIRRSVSKSLGISAALGRAATVKDQSGTLLDPLTGSGAVGSPVTGTIRFGLFAGDPFSNLALALDALETEGLVNTLAEPNLTALSGESASFLAGGEIPVPAGVDQNGNLTVEFRDFGVDLAFTPTVLDSGRINLSVATSVSAVDPNNTVTIQGVAVPGFSTRRAQTTVEMASGGGLVIGGLLQNDFSNIIAGFPGLNDIPFLGALFRSTAFSRAETELVVTVSAFLVRPVPERALVLPTDGFAPASDIDMYFLGKLHSTYGVKGAKQPAGKPNGPVGFVME